uniref:Uncharacterized protein n=1 Tax=viral metagenome TaxID=1070528 RepID=A0A6M3KJS2_9ZZZZ
MKPPTRGRSTKVLDGVTAGASILYSDPIDDLLFFNTVTVVVTNAHATQTLDFLVQAKINREDVDAVWITILAQNTLSADSSDTVTVADAADLNAAWDAIRIGYVQSDGSNKGTLNAWINRK